MFFSEECVEIREIFFCKATVITSSKGNEINEYPNITLYHSFISVSILVKHLAGPFQQKHIQRFSLTAYKENITNILWFDFSFEMCFCIYVLEGLFGIWKKTIVCFILKN